MFGFVFSVWFLLVEGDVGFAGFLSFRDLDQDAGDESQMRFLVWEVVVERDIKRSDVGSGLPPLKQSSQS